MESINHPLDWWAYGGHAEVIRLTGWSPPQARREVRRALKTLGFRPIGHRGYLDLRRRIMAGQLFTNDLI